MNLDNKVSENRPLLVRYKRDREGDRIQSAIGATIQITWVPQSRCDLVTGSLLDNTYAYVIDCYTESAISLDTYLRLKTGSKTYTFPHISHRIWVSREMAASVHVLNPFRDIIYQFPEQ